MSESQPRRKPKQLSSSEHLPYDVIFDILTRLPVKSLIKFRCVSKSWNSIITKPDFIKTHFDRLSHNNNNNNNNNGYLLYTPSSTDSSRNELCTVVCNSDYTLTEISRLQIPFSNVGMIDFCNGIICMYNYNNNVIYLWNPRIRKFKMLSNPQLTDPFSRARVVLGLAYHSQNNDFKILIIVPYYDKGIGGEQMPVPAVAEVYTLTMDSWRKVQFEPNIGSIVEIVNSSCLFFNGALHSVAYSRDYKFMLSFDVNGERFHEIILPPNYLDRACKRSERLAVFKGSLAVIVLGEGRLLDRGKCHMWVMREYGVVESWTKMTVMVNWVDRFFCCTDSGEVLIHTLQRGLITYDLDSCNENKLGILCPPWLNYTIDLMESLFLLD